MKKIQLTENDIEKMVLESVQRLLSEGWRPIHRHFKGPDGEDYEDYDGEEWDGVDDDEDEDTVDDEEDEDTLQEDRSYDTWLGHRQLPGSDGRFFNVEFYVDANGEINYRYRGDSSQRTPEPFERGQIPWLDKQVEEWINSPEGQASLKANLFL